MLFEYKLARTWHNCLDFFLLIIHLLYVYFFFLPLAFFRHKEERTDLFTLHEAQSGIKYRLDQSVYVGYLRISSGAN